VAVGHRAGFNLMSANSVAIGHNSGVDNMGQQSVAIGNQSGETGMGSQAVGIGNRAGKLNLGSSSVAIGDRASNDGGLFASTIVINGTGTNLNPSQANSTYIKPIRSLTQAQTLHYDDGTGEITRTPNVSLTQGDNITITGTYPAFTIASTGGGGANAIRFNGVFNSISVASGGMPLLDNTRCITGFNENRFAPVGGGWDLINGIFTAPRDCFMNFNFMITAQFNSSSSEAVILHQRNLVAPFIYEYQLALMQNTSSNFSFYNFNINGVLFVRAGEIVRVGLKSPSSFTAFSGGRNAAVSFSGYNID